MHNPEERNQHKVAPTLPPRFEDLGSSDQLGDGTTKPEPKERNESSKSDTNQPLQILGGEYTPPSWGALPRFEYFFEVVKSGQMLETVPLFQICQELQQSFVTIGRAPENDVEAQHPTVSRVHAIIQFHEDGKAFLFDKGSTHGTFLNKIKAPVQKYQEFHVGDQMILGQSTRSYILQGPKDLLPEEGMNREVKRQFKALEMFRKRKEAEEKAAQEQMRIAVSSNHESQMKIPENLEIDFYTGEFDWRSYESDKGLTEKQQKIAEKIRKKERKIEHLKQENEKILAKRKEKESHFEDSLSAGQVSTLARNEKEIDLLVEQIEDFEENLIDSIKDSLGIGHNRMKQKRAHKTEDDDQGSSSDDDIMYDRTKTRRGSKKRKDGRKRRKDGSIDANGICMRIVDLQRDKDRIEELIRVERLRKKNDASEAKPLEATDDTLESFMNHLGSDTQSLTIESLEKSLKEISESIEDARSLLLVADPDGLFQDTLSRMLKDTNSKQKYHSM
eukprot:jgi/Picsp_1/5689/NSC_03048-R1_adaptor protein kanadaptin